MNPGKSAKRRTSLLALALVIIALPACHGARPLSENSSRVAYRPVQTSLTGRPFSVSGYGGADYSPARPRRGAPANIAPAYVTPAPAPDTPAVTIRQGTWDEP